MDKEKIAKLQAQIRIGMFIGVVGDETDTMPSLSIRHTIPYIYLQSIIYQSTIIVSLLSTVLHLAPLGINHLATLDNCSVSQNRWKRNSPT